MSIEDKAGKKEERTENMEKEKNEGRNSRFFYSGFGRQLVFAVFNVIFLISLAVTLTVLFRPLYYFDINYLDIPEHSGYSEQTCRENYDVLIDYNLLISPDKLEFPDFPMSQEGEIHFAEVKRIFVGAQLAALVGLPCFVGRLIWQRRRKNGDFRWLGMTVWVCLALVALVGGCVAVSWETAFVWMHKILFRNDYWIFNAETDPVIRILPDSFFMHCGILILALLSAFLIFCVFLKKKQEGILKEKRS